MSFFPAYLDLKDRRVLIVGGGRVALGKLKRLLEFSENMVIISPEFLDEFLEFDIELVHRCYRRGDIEGFDIVIVATDNIELQREIFIESRGSGILVNCVDSMEYCDFIFPSYIKKGHLTISISTDGASPAVTKALREYIEELIPPDIDIFLRDMKSLRESLPKGESRIELFREMSRDFIDRYREER